MPIETIRDLNADTIEELQQLYASNKASESFYLEAAEKVDDGATTGLFGEIANERMLQAAELRDHLYATDEEPESESTFRDSVHEAWTRMRATINAGKLRVLLIETERAEDRLLGRYRSSIKATPGPPLNDVLLRHYRQVKERHDRIRALRDSVS